MSSSHVSVSSAANMFAVASAENKTKKNFTSKFQKKDKYAYRSSIKEAASLRQGVP